MTDFLTSVLPNYMKDSLSCFTFVESKLVDGGPDIATCDTNGFMHEMKNKKILRSLSLSGKGIFISCSYILQNEKITLYYLVLTETHKLLVITRTRIRLQIVKAFDQVQKFEVYDFECIGLPQVRISFLNGEDDLVWRFSMQKPGTTGMVRLPDSYEVITTKEQMRSSMLRDSLEDKLQILNRHIDELSEEYNLVRKQFSSQELPTEFGMVPVGTVKFLLPLEKPFQPLVKVCDKWIKVIGSSLTVGIKIHNCGCEIMSDVEVVLKQKEVRDYAYRIFEASNDLRGDFFCWRDGQGSVKGGGEAWVVGGFDVPGFLSHSVLSVTCCVTFGESKTCLVRESFEVTALDVASQSSAGLEERFTVEDLMAMRTLKAESHLEIRMEGMEKDALGRIWVKDLGFIRMSHLKDEMFYCSSGYLKEVLVAVREMRENPCVWRMVLLTSDESQIYLLVNALYDLLGEKTRISVLEREE